MNGLVSCRGACSLVINELNTHEPTFWDFSEYIELRAVECSANQPNLNPYLLLIIQGSNPVANGPAIVFSADLNRKVMPKGSDYFLIGADSLEPNLPFSDGMVGIIGKEKMQQGTRKLETFFGPKKVLTPTGGPFAVVLLKVTRSAGGVFGASKEAVDGVKISFLSQQTHRSVDRVTPIPLTEEKAIFIKTWLHDMVIFNEEPYGDVRVFENLAEELRGKPVEEYELRPASEWNRRGRKFCSINRCPTNAATRTPLLFFGYKLGAKTPGKPNDCSDRNYILSVVMQETNTTTDQPESALEDESSSLLEEDGEESAATAGGECPIGNENSIALDLKISDLEHKLDAIYKIVSGQSFTNVTPTESQSATSPQLKRQKTAEAEKESRNSEETEAIQQPIKEWKRTDLFSDDWKKWILKYHSQHISGEHFFTPLRRNWLELLISPDGLSATYRCRHCHKRGLGQEPETLVDLAKEQGWYGNALRQKLYKHEIGKYHESTITLMKNSYYSNLERLVDEYQKGLDLQVTKDVAATENMIRTVYAEVRANVPFDSHETFVLLQRLNGLTIGTHHFERSSATRMVASMSETMHSTLVDYLKSNESPISLLLDTSTDPTTNNYLIMLLRSMEENTPKIYFYKLLKVEKEAAEDLATLIAEAFADDGLEERMREKLVATGTDGAAVMLGKKGGLVRKLAEKYNKDLFTIHCHAHKLELAIGKCFEALPFLKNNFESTINELYSFFAGHSVKRHAHLVSVALELDVQLKQLSYINPVRWVASELSALQRVHSNFKPILYSLTEIVAKDNSNFDQATKNKGMHLFEILTETRFVAILLFLQDVLGALKEVSLHYQRSEAVVIGQEVLRQELLETVELFKRQDGVNLKLFLDKSVCFKRNAYQKCSSEDLDDRNFLFHGEERLFLQKKVDSEYPPLTTFREQLCELLTEEISSYFPEGSLEAFEALNPRNLPNNAGQVATYKGEIMAVAERFNHPVIATAEDFGTFLHSAMEANKERYCYLKEKDPLTFWTFYLSEESTEISDNLRNLVNTVLVLPVASSDVERAFSILFHIRSERRSRLTTENLQNLLRLRLNGPSLEDLNARKYAKAWIKAGHFETDDPRLRGKQKKTEKDSKKKYLSRSLLF